MGYIGRDSVRKNMELIGSPKVFIAAAYGERGKFPYQVLGYPFIGHKAAVCTETYLCFGPLANRKECEKLCGYISTRLFRFLVMLKKSTQHAMRPVYDFVPMQDFSEPWTDEKLYAKYGITKSEQKFIESLIKPME